MTSALQRKLRKFVSALRVSIPRREKAKLADRLYDMSMDWLEADPKRRLKVLSEAKSRIIQEFASSESHRRLSMTIGERLRAMREEKNLSQGDIERKTGLLRCYISRVENSHTVPAIETLEKMAGALEVPLYQLFYDSKEPPELPRFLKRKSSSEITWGSTGKDARFLNKLRRVLSKADEEDRKLVLHMAQKVARR